MKNSFIILLFFIAGVILGLFHLIPDVMIQNDFSKYALYILMFLVGISVGSDKSSWKALIQYKLKIFLVPLCVIIGSLLGTALISIFLPDLKINEVMAVGAGFGYYSLSSIFITEISGPTLGVIALLSNILREITTLLLSPFFAKYFGKLAPIASGGATSMDTTLPIIVKSSGKEYAIISVFSGIVLTILVPFFVTIILKLF
ncbi:MAG: lysine exporter LysO family protein [Bacteroidetes bacterium]|nr:lysine exporter LysO family protein [Bacteroidota bacterium]